MSNGAYIVAPGVTRQDYHNWGGYYIEGNQEDIIKAGLATPDWFEDGSRRNKRGQIVRSKSFEVDGLEVHTTTMAKSSFCRVRRYFTEQEIKEFEAKAAKREQLANHLTPDEFREKMEDMAIGLVRTILSDRKALTKTCGDYRYTLDAAAVANILNAIEAAAQGLRTAPVRVEKLVDPAQKKAARDQAASAAVDPAFQRFIGRAVGAPPDAAAGA